MNPIRSLALVLCAVALSACEKNAVQDITGPLPAARVKFYNFGVGAPAVNFYADERKMTAVSSTTGNESVGGIGYGGVGPGNLYAAIDPGQHTLSGRISAATDKDLPISNLPATIESGKHYSFFQSGFYNATEKNVDAFIVEDVFPAAIDYSATHVRFVNAISNSQPMTMYAVHTVTGDTSAVGSTVAYKSGGAFTPLPSGVYNLFTRHDGSTTNVIVRTGVNLLAGRVYTIAARGDMTIVSTTAATRPFLDFTSNR